MTARRRRACQTIARNIADINGTSVISSNGCAPRAISMASRTPVTTMIAPNKTNVDLRRQTLKP